MNEVGPELAIHPGEKSDSPKIYQRVQALASDAEGHEPEAVPPDFRTLPAVSRDDRDVGARALHRERNREPVREKKPVLVDDEDDADYAVRAFVAGDEWDGSERRARRRPKPTSATSSPIPSANARIVATVSGDSFDVLMAILPTR